MIQRPRRVEEAETVGAEPRSMERSTTIQELEMTRREPTISDILMGDYDEDDDDLDSIDSLSTVEDLVEDEDPLLQAVEDSTSVTSIEVPQVKVVKFLPTNVTRRKELDVSKYMSEREMTPLQERMNAVTILPNPIYCLYFILAGHWVSQELLNEFRDKDVIDVDESLCIQSTWFPNFHAMPPATVLAVFLGITMHAPWSFLYHWKYASTLPPGLPRTSHWSRRMDHAMIHTASTFLAYANSASWDYLVANALFNADCIYRQFKPKVRPRRNQIRVGISILAYTIPFLRRGEFIMFSRCWLVLSLSAWFFIKYPVGGWSHSVFHMVVAFLPPLIMHAASTLPSSEDQLKVAAQCAVLAERALQA